ncbi:hypothetical protein [Microbacterium sp.]
MPERYPRALTRVTSRWLVPLDEIANAMAVAAELGGGVAEEELKR